MIHGIFQGCDGAILSAARSPRRPASSAPPASGTSAPPCRVGRPRRSRPTPSRRCSTRIGDRRDRRGRDLRGHHVGAAVRCATLGGCGTWWSSPATGRAARPRLQPPLARALYRDPPLASALRLLLARMMGVPKGFPAAATPAFAEPSPGASSRSGPGPTAPGSDAGLQRRRRQLPARSGGGADADRPRIDDPASYGAAERAAAHPSSGAGTRRVRRPPPPRRLRARPHRSGHVPRHATDRLNATHTGRHARAEQYPAPPLEPCQRATSAGR